MCSGNSQAFNTIEFKHLKTGSNMSINYKSVTTPQKAVSLSVTKTTPLWSCREKKAMLHFKNTKHKQIPWTKYCVL